MGGGVGREGMEGDMRGLEGREKAFCVFFEWKYMMYCVSLCKLKFVFPCVNVISKQGSP